MTVRFATLTLCLLAALPVHAERADREARADRPAEDRPITEADVAQALAES